MHQCELEIIGATHADLGGMLADKWNLPSELRDAIALHHSSGGIGSQLNDCLFIANQITKKLSFGSAGNFVVEPLAESMVNRFSMDMDALIADLPSLAEEVESARIFIKLGESR
jgi:hypothetical protein